MKKYIKSADYELNEYGNPVFGGMEFASDSDMLDYEDSVLDQHTDIGAKHKYEITFKNKYGDVCTTTVSATDESDAITVLRQTLGKLVSKTIYDVTKICE